MTRFLLLPLAALLVGGCSLFGGDRYDDLALGTCEFRASTGITIGTSEFTPFLDQPFTEATVNCVNEDLEPGQRPFIAIVGDEFLVATVGNRFEPANPTTFGNGAGRSYRYQSGEVEIERVSGSHVGGRFSLRMRHSPFSGGGAETITVEGGFYVDTVE